MVCLQLSISSDENGFILANTMILFRSAFCIVKHVYVHYVLHVVIRMHIL